MKESDVRFLRQNKRNWCSFGIFIAWWYLLSSSCVKIILTCSCVCVCRFNAVVMNKINNTLNILHLHKSETIIWYDCCHLVALMWFAILIFHLPSEKWALKPTITRTKTTTITSGDTFYKGNLMAVGIIPIPQPATRGQSKWFGPTFEEFSSLPVLCTVWIKFQLADDWNGMDIL